MTVADLRCDRCGAPLAGPEGIEGASGRLGVRFTYHPGAPELKDDSGLACTDCWRDIVEWLGAPASTDRCVRCGDPLQDGRLVVVRPGELLAWFLCRSDAVTFLNGLRTVDPKLDAETFRFPTCSAPGETGH